MSDEPKDHAVTGGRDESLHNEGGHSSEYHTVVLANTDEQQVQRTSQTKIIVPWIEGTYREPSITKGATLSSDVGGKPETCHGVVTYRKSDSEEEAQTEPQPRSKW